MQKHAAKLLLIVLLMSILLSSCGPKLEELRIENSSVIITYGESVQLIVVTEPADARIPGLIWLGDGTVVNVDDEGMVQAVGVGSTTITVETKDGKYVAQADISVLPKIAMQKEFLSLEADQTETLYLLFEPEDSHLSDISWNTSNPEVASVDQIGSVTAHSPGDAIITASAADGMISIICNVTVKTTPVQSVSVSKQSIILTVGSSSKIVAKIQPDNATNKKIIWSSNDSKVATVSESGDVKAIAPGTAKITATSQEGDLTAHCTVTVKKASSSSSGSKYPIIYRNRGLASTGGYDLNNGVPPNCKVPYKIIFRENKMGYMTIEAENYAIFESWDLIVYLIQDPVAPVLYFKRNDHSISKFVPNGYSVKITSRETGQLLFQYYPK